MDEPPHPESDARQAAILYPAPNGTFGTVDAPSHLYKRQELVAVWSLCSGAIRHADTKTQSPASGWGKKERERTRGPTVQVESRGHQSLVTYRFPLLVGDSRGAPATAVRDAREFELTRIAAHEVTTAQRIPMPSDAFLLRLTAARILDLDWLLDALEEDPAVAESRYPSETVRFRSKVAALKKTVQRLRNGTLALGTTLLSSSP